MLWSKGILARQTLYKFLTQKGDELMLEVKNLTFQVNENGIERSIVENISFNVKDGEMLVITGPNGGGKSTLAKVLMGIDQASAGQIILDGTDISDYEPQGRSRNRLRIPAATALQRNDGKQAFITCGWRRSDKRCLLQTFKYRWTLCQRIH